MKPDTSEDRFIYFGFLILIAWLPLPLGSNRPWAEAIVEVWIYSLMLFWLIAFMRNKVEITDVFKKAAPVVSLFFIWLIWILLQFIPLPAGWIAHLSPVAFTHHSLVSATDLMTLSLDPHATVAGWLKSLAYILVFILSLLLINSRRRLRQLAYTIIYSGLFQAVYGSLMTLSGLGYGFFSQNPAALSVTTGTFINRNHLAAYLVMALSVGIGMMIARLDTENGYTPKQRLLKYFQLILSSKLRLRLYLAIMVIALVLTHSRMGNSSFFTSLIVAGGFGLILSKYATRGTIILLISLIAIDVFIVGTWFGLEKVAVRIEQTTLATETRDEVDIYAYQQLKDYQWTGSGLGSFYSVFPKYSNEDVGGFYDHTHNDYLEFATDTGVIGIALLGLVIVMSITVALVAQYRRKDPLMRGISFAAIMSICAMLIHATVDFNLQIPANAATFMLILSMAWISYGFNNKVKKKRGA
ncbi:MAG: putative inorganic carbon (HCO3(-)) transporter [Gammaproteobacteria bacterium]|jgi:putative inorganic carbon (HCO3(-)) transporter